MKTLLFSLLALSCLTGYSSAASIYISFHNGATTLAAVTIGNASLRPPGTLVNVANDTWNNINRNGNTTFPAMGLAVSGFALKDAAGATTGATMDVNAGASGFNNNGWGTATQDSVMMEGHYDLGGTESITISGLPASVTGGGYNILVFGDLTGTLNVMDYTIGSTTLTINDNAPFTGTFSAASMVTFTGQTASSFTLTGNATGARSAVAAIVIQPVPEPSAALLGAVAAVSLAARRRRA